MLLEELEVVIISELELELDELDVVFRIELELDDLELDELDVKCFCSAITIIPLKYCPSGLWKFPDRNR